MCEKCREQGLPEINEKELRAEIKANLTLACDTWPLVNLMYLEQLASDVALSGIAYHNMQPTLDAMTPMVEKLLDTLSPKNKPEYTLNPGENNVFKALADKLAKLREKTEDKKQDEPEVKSEGSVFDQMK
jgi:hypothetical protein